MTRPALLALAFAAALPGCEFLRDLAQDGGPAESGDTGTVPVATPYDDLAFTTDAMRSNGQGVYSVEVVVPEGATSFQVTSVSPEYPALERVTDPNGDEVLFWRDLFTSPRSVTLAVFPSRQETAFNWPIQQADGPLIPGTYVLDWALVDASGNYAADAKVDVTTVLKTDPDLQAGQVHVRIVWAQGLDQQPKVVTAVEQAVEHWREVWADSGLTLVERYETSALSPSLDFTWGGSPEVNRVSETKEKGELQLVVGESVDGDTYTYGVSAGIPGTILPSRSTFVVLAWLTHAGPDGKFSENDIQVMGETMAHEMGHYIGLFHPVEMNYRNWDALEDTEECSSARSCESGLGFNLMFPYSLCSFTACESQYQITRDQQGVLQRAVGTL